MLWFIISRILALQILQGWDYTSNYFEYSKNYLFFQEEPNAYVKVYLHPDPTKITKRKTKIVRRNCNPSFMEMLEYRIPLEVVQCRTLQATVWDNSQFQENMFLGSVTLPLDKMDLGPGAGEERWYSLGQFYRWSNDNTTTVTIQQQHLASVYSSFILPAFF